jgi:hypothetical protein
MLFFTALLQHWRILLSLAAVLAVGAYIYTAEQAKSELALAQARSAIADSLAQSREAQSAVLTQQIDSLREEVQDADTRYAKAVARLRHVPRPPHIPAGSPDTTKEIVTADTGSVLDLPEVQEVLEACEKRVEVRDQIILRQDLRRAADSLTIAELRILAPRIHPPPQPSRTQRVLLGAAVGLVGGLAAQQVSGEKGLVVATSLGAVIGFLR